MSNNELNLLIEEELEKGLKNWLAGAGAAAVMGASSIASAGSGHMHDAMNHLTKPLARDGVKVTSQFNPSSEGSKHGSGSYHVKVGPYNIKANHSSVGSGNYDHKQVLTVDKGASEEDKAKWENTAKMVHGKLKVDSGTISQKAMQKSERLEFNALGQWSIKNG